MRHVDFEIGVVTFGVTMKSGNGILLNLSPGMRHLKQERLLTIEHSASATIPDVVIVAMPRNASGSKRNMMPGSDVRTHSFLEICCLTLLKP